jgi:hypothetical protein
MLLDNLIKNVFSNATRNAATVLLGMAACTGLASAQTQFLITSDSSGLALDVTASSTAPGGSIQQSVPTAAANQLWTMRRHGASFSYEIVSVNSGLVLDVPGSSTKPGTYIQQYTANGGNNQLWHFLGAGPTSYVIVANNQEELPGPAGCGLPGSALCLAGYANLVLDVPDFSTQPGRYIQQYTENDGTNQQWVFHAQPSGNFLRGLTFTGITVSSADSITVNGFGFAAGSEVCPVFEAAYTSWATPCATVAANGTFSYQNGAPNQWYDASEAGYVVVIVEDKNENVLAIGSVPGDVQPPIK